MSRLSQPHQLTMWKHAKHIACLISLHSNNPIRHMPIVAQLVGVELGHESDFKPEFYNQIAILFVKLISIRICIFCVSAIPVVTRDKVDNSQHLR